MSSPVTLRLEGGIALVKIDNPPVNATARSVRRGLMQALDGIRATKARVAIVHCAGPTFIAGGDISEFGQPPQPPHLPDVYQAIECCPTPWIAAMHGTVLGGGFELAMACAFRIAEASTRFGLPEVNIGLIPGAGGSQRLPRLIGAEPATRIATSGAMMPAPDLLALGGLDQICTGEVLSAALEFARNLPPRPSAVSTRQVPSASADFFATTRAELVKKSKGQTSPLHNLDAVEWAGKTDFQTGQARERKLHLDLRDTAQSRALRHAFFAERQVSKPDAIKGATARQISRVAVVGGGLMGAGIAFACLNTGLQVTLIERDQAAAKAGAARISGLIEGGVTRGKISVERAGTLRSALVTSAEYLAAKDADLAIEAVFEDMTVKQAVFRSLAAVMDRDAILATNTSYLDPVEIMEGIENPSRCIGLHFFSPAHIMKLLEIVQLPATSAEVLATGFVLGKQLGKIGVLSRICDGFIGNRILSAYRRQADYLLLEGCLPAQIDAAMRGFGMPMGPYELQDLTGLQISWANRKRQAPDRDPRERYVRLGDLLCQADRLGQRSTKGWYRYEQGNRTPIVDQYVTDLVLSEARQAEITRRNYTEAQIVDLILAAMINEGALIIEEGIAERPLDVDMVEIHGFGFPRWRGGPMHYAREIGIRSVSAAMKQVMAASPDSWTLSNLLS